MFAYPLRKSIVCSACVEKIIRKEMVDPLNGKSLQESDIIELQRGGTGYAATNDLKAKLIRPQLELQ
jgi:nitric oxide synthase-interacting protein